MKNANAGTNARAQLRHLALDQFMVFGFFYGTDALSIANLHYLAVAQFLDRGRRNQLLAILANPFRNIDSDRTHVEIRVSARLRTARAGTAGAARPSLSPIMPGQAQIDDVRLSLKTARTWSRPARSSGASTVAPVRRPVDDDSVDLTLAQFRAKIAADEAIAPVTSAHTV